MPTNSRRLVWALCLLLPALACGPGVYEDGELGELAGDDGTGDEVVAVDPMPGPDCAEAACDETPFEPIELDGGAVDEEDAGELLEPDAGDADAGEPAVDAGAPTATDAGVTTAVDAGTRDAGAVDAGPASPWAVGAKILVRGYVTFRSAPSSTASAVTTVDPNGGVTDSAHGGGMPRGQLTPGQVVTLASATKSSGYYRVTYDGKTGWLPASWLEPLPTSGSRVAFALGTRVRNAFFKHQLHRSKWNKDGPYSSGTCAPTSLAMAVHFFGKEPTGLSVEQSIHRARLSYGATSDGTGTFRSQITTGAKKLGLNVKSLDTRLSLASMLSRIDTQLAAKRAVVLEGQPGIANAGATTYQKAFNRAYAAAGLSNTYTFDGRHSIVVLGKDAASGKYVVGDPLSEVGMVTLTGAELKDFFARWGGTGNAVWP